MKKEERISNFKENQIYLLFVVLPSIFLFPKIIQLFFVSNSMITAAIGGGLGGLVGASYLGLYKNKEKKVKILLTIVYLAVIISFFVVVDQIFQPVYMKEIKPALSINSENTYSDSKYNFKINYPEKWRIGEKPIDSVKVYFVSNILSQNDFYANYNIGVTPINQKITIKQLLDNNQKIVDKLINEKGYDYTLISNKNIIFLDGDATQTISNLNQYNMKFTQMQISFFYKWNIYTITFTDTSENFNKTLLVFMDSIKTIR